MLDPQESQHAHGARRLAVSDCIWLFDGHGTVGQATVASVDQRTRALQAKIERCHVVAPPHPRVELACVLPKGERQSVLLDMATQLGMGAFRPLSCERSVVKPGHNASRRWRRICVEACKQSRRPHLPVIHDPIQPAELIAEIAPAGHIIWVAHRNGSPVLGGGLFGESRTGEIPDPFLLMIGPEGGFTDAEISQIAANNGRLVSLGSAILRIETAAIALLAYVVWRARF